jgi:hypothetical protein
MIWPRKARSNHPTRSNRLSAVSRSEAGQDKRLLVLDREWRLAEEVKLDLGPRWALLTHRTPGVGRILSGVLALPFRPDQRPLSLRSHGQPGSPSLASFASAHSAFRPRTNQLPSDRLLHLPSLRHFTFTTPASPADKETPREALAAAAAAGGAGAVAGPDGIRSLLEGGALRRGDRMRVTVAGGAGDAAGDGALASLQQAAAGAGKCRSGRLRRDTPTSFNSPEPQSLVKPPPV